MQNEQNLNLLPPLENPGDAPPDDPDHSYTTRYLNLLTHATRSLRLRVLAILLYTAEFIASIFILTTQWSVECTPPLQMFILLFSGRIALKLPVNICIARYTMRNIDIPTGLFWMHIGLQFYSLLIFFTGQGWLTRVDSGCMEHPVYIYSLVLVVVSYVFVLAPMLLFVVVLYSAKCLKCVFWTLDKPVPVLEILTRLPETTTTEDRNQDCVVCFTDSEINEDRLVTLKCGHAMHRKCVECWLKIKYSCPIDGIQIWNV